MQFQIISRGQRSKEVPESSRSEFFEKFLANNFTLSDAVDNTYGPLNRGGITDLPLSKTVLAIHQKSQESNFTEVIGSFVLLTFGSLAALRTFLQRLLACLNFTLGSEDLFCWCK